MDQPLLLVIGACDIGKGLREHQATCQELLSHQAGLNAQASRAQSRTPVRSYLASHSTCVLMRINVLPIPPALCPAERGFLGAGVCPGPLRASHSSKNRLLVSGGLSSLPPAVWAAHQFLS